MERRIHAIHTTQTCTNCSLHNSPSRGSYIVHGVGNLNADILLVGEGPGVVEAREGTPFVGDAGRVLNTCLSQVGLHRKDVFITNAVRCRPPNNMTPTPSQAKKCRPFLEEELKKIKPKVIVLLGASAMKSVLGSDTSLARYRSIPVSFSLEEYKTIALATYHPAYILRNPKAQDILVSDLQRARTLVTEGLTTSKREVSYHTITTVEKLEKLVKILNQSKYYSLDTETTGFNFLQDKIIAISVSFKSTYAACIPYYLDKTSCYWSEKDKKRVDELIRTMLENSSTKILQNGKFDIKFFRGAGFEVKNFKFDTMLAHHLLDENSLHDLKTLAMRYTDLGDYEKPLRDALKNLKGKKVDKSYDKLPTDLLYHYACTDADATIRLYEIFKPEIIKRGFKDLYVKIVHPFQEVLGDMEFRGVRVDVDLLDKLEIEYSKELEKIKALVNEKVKEPINLSSPKQLQVLLYEKLKLPILKRTRTGASTDKETLALLAERYPHPILKGLLRYRELSKLVSTYLKGMKKLINPVSRNVHTRYQVNGTVTGRISSSSPNLQNIPRDGAIKNLFIPSFNENAVIIEMDYSQAELRVLAYYSQEKEMLDTFNSGGDIHTSVAASVFGKDLENVTKEERNIAKNINFGLAYGRGFSSIAAQLKISSERAREIVDTFFRRYPKVKNWMISTQKAARTKGEVRSLFGRKRRLPEILSPDSNRRAEAERQAINSPIQGTSADITAYCMVRLFKRLKEGNYRTRMLMTVHDSIIFEAPRDEVNEVSKLIREESCRALDFSKLRGLKVLGEVTTVDRWGGNKLEIEEIER